MMYCKGIGCLFREQCARYAIRLKPTDIDRWTDSCKDGSRYIETTNKR